MSKKLLIFSFIITLLLTTIIFSWWQTAKILFNRVEAEVFIENINVEKCTRPQLEQIVAELAKAHETKAVDAVYNKKENTIVPEICGSTVDQIKTINNALKAKKGEKLKLVKIYTNPKITLKNYPKAIVRQGNPQKKQVTLMINVDWGIPDPLSYFLSVLKSFNVTTTFCVTGRIIDKFPETVAQIVLEGHEIASHGYYHHGSTHNYHSMTKQEFIEDFTKTQSALKKAVDTKMIYYSPPSGIINDNILDAALELNYRTVLWTHGLDTVDWREPPSEKIVKKITKNAVNGGIVLMHPKQCTLDALPQLLEWFKNNNYEVVPLRELLSPYNKEVKTCD
ncbi:polysaccharide deacetylase family protein [Clostridium sp. 'deep sea']|uniref:polysaccharide deacetylase family protein n=1 Tax=Clostridium sp. 'deep sea' TaxID=2779445 RepID=UPI0018964CBB|nr:polysaccharide deacetylase family protein [Clostridium sp. 'deep sea']QOR36012.1 polysaccharide deacetylase family protein [Clostridium sp. 'deep sea']